MQAQIVSLRSRLAEQMKVNVVDQSLPDHAVTKAMMAVTWNSLLAMADEIDRLFAELRELRG